MVAEAKEPDRKKCSLLLLFIKARTEKALLCQERLCAVEQDGYSTSNRSYFNHDILSF